MRFSLAHPQWQPPGHSSKFLGHLRGRVQQDAAAWGAPSTRSPPTPGVLSDCTSPLVSSRLAYLLPNPTLHLSLAFQTLCVTLAARLNLSYFFPFFGPSLYPFLHSLALSCLARSLPGQPLGESPPTPEGPESHSSLPSSHSQPPGLYFTHGPGPQVRGGGLRCRESGLVVTLWEKVLGC